MRSKPPSTRSTIADVARLADVSIKTVSRVINEEPNVSDDTRARVREAVEALDFRPNPSARSLASRRSHLIALLYDNPSASYLINIQSGTLVACRAGGYDLLICPCDYRAENIVQNVADMVTNTLVDGLILTPPLADLSDLTQALDEHEVPFVRIAPRDRADESRAVRTNDEDACAEMTRYLASLGHTSIAFISGHPDHGAVTDRYAGYRKGLKSSGLRFDRRLVAQGYNSFESGEQCARRLLEAKNRPTAIFAANDDMAAGAMKVAHEVGLNIPGHLSVAGFDDVPLASHVWPALTTIKQPIEAMAQSATSLLLALLQGQSSPDIPHTIDSSLVVRESTGPAPGAAVRAAGAQPLK